ncbi:hypothetical protein K438DRAFT_677928 [Mycena galopus ATCC 62051]|nr:hypothetical protein K438DRAFT_677928 [Mycena galopus ATCC 62051]
MIGESCSACLIIRLLPPAPAHPLLSLTLPGPSLTKVMHLEKLISSDEFIQIYEGYDSATQSNYAGKRVQNDAPGSTRVTDEFAIHKSVSHQRGVATLHCIFTGATAVLRYKWRFSGLWLVALGESLGVPMRVRALVSGIAVAVAGA